MKYRKIALEIEATQWFENGDHPRDKCFMITGRAPAPDFLSEGKVVRYFRRANVLGTAQCSSFGYNMHDHGWIDNGKDGYCVCPGDYVITTENEIYPCKPKDFMSMWDPMATEDRELLESTKMHERKESDGKKSHK